MKGVHIGMIQLELGQNLHCTLVRRYDASPEDLVAMQQEVEKFRNSETNVLVYFGNFCHMGENGCVNSVVSFKIYNQCGWSYN